MLKKLKIEAKRGMKYVAVHEDGDIYATNERVSILKHRFCFLSSSIKAHGIVSDTLKCLITKNEIKGV